MAMVKAGEALTRFLREHHFDHAAADRMRNLVFRPLQDGRVITSVKYDVLVRLHQALAGNIPQAAGRVLGYLQKINKPLAREIETRAGKKDAGGIPAHLSNPQGLIRTMLEVIESYPHDTLREPGFQPAYSSRYNPKAVNGAMLMETINLGLSGLAAALFGKMAEPVPEDHQANKRKIRRRYPR